MLTVNNTDKMHSFGDWALDGFGSKWHYGTVLESHFLFHWLICEVGGQETGSKSPPPPKQSQNAIRHNTTLTLST